MNKPLILKVKQFKDERDAAEAELIRWRSAFQSFTPGGSEFSSPEAVREWAQHIKNKLYDARIALAKTQKELAELKRQKPLTREELESALGCFWNAAIGFAHQQQDPTAMATISAMAEGIAAVEHRLKEFGEEK